MYNIENNKQKLKGRGAVNIITAVKKLFKDLDLFNNVNEGETIKNYFALQGRIIESEIKIFLDDCEKIDYRKFLKFFKKIKSKCNNFNYLPSYLILEDSRIIKVFRIISGLSQKEFAKKTGISNMTIEELENGYRKIRWPVTAREYAKKILPLIKNSKNLENNWRKWKNTRKTKKSKHSDVKTIKHMDTNYFKKYFSKIISLTNNFKTIKPELFQETPKNITIFRILLGLTQSDLERKLKSKGRYISNYESGVYRTLNRGRAELFCDFFKKEFNDNHLYNLTETEAIQRFLMTKDKMSNHINSTKIALKKAKLTNQENKIFKILNKINGIRIKTHENVETKSGLLNIDFLIFKKDLPIIALEATSFYHPKSKKYSYNSKRKISEIDYKFIKLKTVYPNIKTVIIIDTEEDELRVYRIKKTILENTLATNNSFINNRKENLYQFIKEEI